MGEAIPEWKTRGVAGTIEDLKNLITGKDLRDIAMLTKGTVTSSKISISLNGFSVLQKNNPPDDVMLIINNRWNYALGLRLGNYVKEPIVIGSQYRNEVVFLLKAK